MSDLPTMPDSPVPFEEQLDEALNAHARGDALDFTIDENMKKVIWRLHQLSQVGGQSTVTFTQILKQTPRPRPNVQRR